MSYHLWFGLTDYLGNVIGFCVANQANLDKPPEDCKILCSKSYKPRKFIATKTEMIKIVKGLKSV